MFSVAGSSQSGALPVGMMTGIRSWIGRMSAFAAVVIMVQVRSSSPSGERHVSKRPAKPNGLSLFNLMYMGILPDVRRCHS